MLKNTAMQSLRMHSRYKEKFRVSEAKHIMDKTSVNILMMY